MEALNIYLAILIGNAPARAPQFLPYQRIITSASSQHSFVAWLNYDTSFCTLAALDCLLQWDVRLTDLWLECFSGISALMIQWPCVHCGATTHYPKNYLMYAKSMFEPPRGQYPSPTSTSTGGQHPPPTPGNVSRPLRPFILERKLSNHSSQPFIKWLINDFFHGYFICYKGPQFPYRANNLVFVYQQSTSIDATLK